VASKSTTYSLTNATLQATTRGTEPSTASIAEGLAKLQQEVSNISAAITKSPQDKVTNSYEKRLSNIETMLITIFFQRKAQSQIDTETNDENSTITVNIDKTNKLHVRAYAPNKISTPISSTRNSSKRACSPLYNAIFPLINDTTTHKIQNVMGSPMHTDTATPQIT
jgi:paraquat-inducible protein B